MEIFIRREIKFAILFTAILAPGFVFAQFAADLFGVIAIIANLLNAVLPVLIGLALIYFIWGVAKYILSAGDESAKAQGRNIMIYGIIALFVIVAVWGLVGLLVNTFVIDTSGQAPITPQI